MEYKHTTCRLCDRECHLVAGCNEAGELVSLRPEHESGTISCPTGLHALELMNHPDRVRRPLLRTGVRGGNEWREISWEEAFDLAAQRLGEVLAQHAPDGLLMIKGFNKPLQGAIFDRMANVLGVVNRLGAGNMCHQAQAQSFADTFGFQADRRITRETRTVLLWGSNPSNTMRWVQRDIAAMKRAGGRLVVIDPLPTRMAELADLHLPIRPGTDAALALGMMRLILEQHWEDRAFLEQCCTGLEEVRAACQPYTLSRTAEITGLREADIEAAAQWLACSGPAIIFGGNALDHNWDSYQKGRCLAILLALTGNVDQAGAAIPARGVKNPARSPRLTCPDRMPDGWRERMWGWREPLLDTARQTSGQEMLKGIQQGQLRAGWVMGGDPAMMWADSHRTAQILSQLDFLMVQDFFLTPTARLADLVLPVATHLEYENIYLESDGTLRHRPALAKHPWGKSDMEIINSIACRMGLQADFWPDMDHFWMDFLAETGVELEELRRLGAVATPTPAPWAPSCRSDGFPTSDGKVHLSLPRLREKGGEAVPSYRPLPAPDTQYPDRCTNYKPGPFFQSAGHQMPGQRKLAPEPVAYLSPDIAAREQIADGDWIKVSTSTGEVCQRARVCSELPDGLVALAIGWWDPEAEDYAEALRFNCNNLASAEELLGGEIQAFSCRGIRCRVEADCGK